jgi:HlyD family secretion protein
MDILRKDYAEKLRKRRLVQVGAGIGLLALITLGVSRLKPAEPSVDRSTVWIDTVKRGQMLRQVRGPGTLVPEEIQWIPAQTEGRVEKIVVRPGAAVLPDTVLVVLSNPELEQQMRDAELQVKAVEADYTDLKVRLESQRMDQKAAAAAVESEFKQAELQLAVDEKLAKDGLVSDLVLNLSRTRKEELATRYDLAEKRLSIASESMQAQLAAQQAHLGQFRAQARLRRDQVAALRVRAGIKGVLEQLPLDVGQRVEPGANLARVADVTRLMAEFRIPETQAKDVQIGQKAEIDTRNGIVPGHVTRIDPAVQNGTVTVDASLDGALPKGARPDLSVDGTIEIERLDDIVYVGRPAFGQEQGTVGLFKLVDGGKRAVRVQVKLGRSSVNTVEVLQGLRPGDRVILSDMSAWDNFDRVRLN